LLAFSMILNKGLQLRSGPRHNSFLCYQNCSTEAIDATFDHDSE